MDFDGFHSIWCAFYCIGWASYIFGDFVTDEACTAPEPSGVHQLALYLEVCLGQSRVHLGHLPVFWSTCLNICSSLVCTGLFKVCNPIFYFCHEFAATTLLELSLWAMVTACRLVAYCLLRFLFSIRHWALNVGISRAMMIMMIKLVNTIPSMLPTAMLVDSLSTGSKPAKWDRFRTSMYF